MKNVTSAKTTETVFVIKRDVDTDTFILRRKEITYVIPAFSRENISNSVTDNRRFREKSEAKQKVGEYAQDEKKKRYFADVVNSTHVNNINQSNIYLDLLKGEKNNSFKITTSPPHVCTNSAESLRRRAWHLVIYTR